MRKAMLLALVVGFLGVTQVAFGQFLADPNDQIYRFLQMWQQEGYVGPLPQVRPYPLQLVKRALESVIAEGGAADAKIARGFLDSYEGNIGLSVPLHIDLFHHSQLRNSDYQGRFGVGIRSTGSITKGVAYSARGEMMVDRVSKGDVYPRWSDSYQATLFNEAKNTGTYRFKLANQDLTAYGDFNGAFFFGTDRLYGQMGLIRSSFGPFIESPVLGPQAPLAGHFSLTYRSKAVTFSSLFLQLVATYGVDKNGNVYKLKGSPNVNFFPSKQLFLNSLDFHPWRWLDLGVFQTALVGARFSPIYFFPFTQYVQNYFGDWDNSFVGMTATVRLPLDLQYDLIAYVDDINLSKMLKLDFNSNENRVAIRTGLSWIAPIDLPNRLQLNYLMITPYTYTHYISATANYLQYTNQGVNLGSVLQPNSDQWNLRLFLMPLTWLQLEAWLSRTRHGTGSVFEDGVLPDGTRTYTGPSTFLQGVLEKDLQAGMSASVQWARGKIGASLTGGYTFEVVQNKDSVAAAPEEFNNYVSIGLTLSY